MQFKSFADLEKDIKQNLLPKLPRTIKTVYGIPRSGMLPASIIATFLGADLAMVGGIPKSGNRASAFSIKGNEVLLVDDSILSGNSMNQAKAVLGMDCLTCAVYANSFNTNKVNFVGVIVDGQRFFEWNFLGKLETPQYMFDMDGVLCLDPEVFDDDGSRYENSLINAKPLFIPQTKIKAICTNRIERWRTVTEAWLQKYNVKYDSLYMQQYKTAVERRASSNPARYKAEHYAKSKAILFIESNDDQAVTINSLTKKPVLSIQKMRVYV